MVFQGNFCPRCGLPVAMATYPVPIRPAPSSRPRSTLSVLWFLAVIGVFLLIALNFAGLILSPAYIVPGIQGISSGQNGNQDFAAGTADWTFEALNSSMATGTLVQGASGSYVQMSLPAGNAGGEWVQAVQIQGSAPFAAEVHLDVAVQPSRSLIGAVAVAMETSPQGIDMAHAAVLWANGSLGWTTTPRLDVSAGITNPGTYYLKVAYIQLVSPGNTLVSFDNIHLGWATDAVFYFYLPLPLPLLLYISQAPGPFLAYFAFILVAMVGSAIWYSWRDRKLTAQAFTAPLEAIGTRLRSKSAWVAVAQVWLAGTFFQSAVIFLLGIIGAPVSSPINVSTMGAWTLIFELAAASVFECIAFRLFLIGVPMTVAVLLFRPSRSGPPSPAGSTTARRAGPFRALRQLWGGQLRRESPREERLVAGILVLISSLLWALAHVEGGGWGWWKAIPVFVMGLGAGYIFVRHGLGASILLHFATDGLLFLYLEGIGGVGLDVLTNLLFLALAFAGSGFFVWYILYGWEEFQDLRRSFGARIVRQPTLAAPVAPPPGAGVLQPGWSYAPPPTWTQVPPGPYGVAPPPNPPPQGYAAPAAQERPPPFSAVARSTAQIPPGFAPTYHPPPYGFPPVRFQCPYCGWVEAKYDARHFTCLRCGRTA